MNTIGGGSLSIHFNIMNSLNKIIHTVLFLIFLLIPYYAISNAKIKEPNNEKPKLIVSIVIDQFRDEFLNRYYNQIGDKGFKKLLKRGFSYRNAHYNFMPTGTGPGHSAIFTGATPSISGIVNNAWFDRSSGKKINVVNGNERYKAIGIPDSINIGRASPEKLLVNTFSDELKKYHQFRSKSITVSIKDRSSILSGGLTADQAYWFDYRTGNFISSTYYINELPFWVKKFNESKIKDSLNNLTWNLSVNYNNQNLLSRKDNNRYERKLGGKESPTFPYNLKSLNEGYNDYFFLPYTPFGNDIVELFAEQAILQENLGLSETIDFLAINFSSLDYAGHIFGPYSLELEDLVIKLDKTIGRLIDFLDKVIGDNNYLIMLTSDHGALGAPEYLKDNRLNSGVFNPDSLLASANNYLKSVFKHEDLIVSGDNYQFYFDKKKIISNNIDELRISKHLKSFLIKKDFIHSVYTKEELINSQYHDHISQLLKNGYYEKRSGDIFYISLPGWLGFSGRIITGHGSPFVYDTHVPILWYGKNIRPGSSYRKVSITSIAPTLSLLSGVMIPNGSFDPPLIELFSF